MAIKRQASRFFILHMVTVVSFSWTPGNYTNKVCKFAESDFPGIRLCFSLLLAIGLTAFVVLSEVILCNVYFLLE